MAEDVERSADNPRTYLKDNVFLSNFEKMLILAAPTLMLKTALQLSVKRQLS